MALSFFYVRHLTCTQPPTPSDLHPPPRPPSLFDRRPELPGSSFCNRQAHASAQHQPAAWPGFNNLATTPRSPLRLGQCSASKREPGAGSPREIAPGAWGSDLVFGFSLARLPPDVLANVTKIAFDPNGAVVYEANPGWTATGPVQPAGIRRSADHAEGVTRSKSRTTIGRPLGTHSMFFETRPPKTFSATPRKFAGWNSGGQCRKRSYPSPSMRRTSSPRLRRAVVLDVQVGPMPADRAARPLEDLALHPLDVHLDQAARVQVEPVDGHQRHPLLRCVDCSRSAPALR